MHGRTSVHVSVSKGVNPPITSPVAPVVTQPSALHQNIAGSQRKTKTLDSKQHGPAITTMPHIHHPDLI
jgi:hypothetical protein